MKLEGLFKNAENKQEFKAGEEIIAEGSEGNEMYVVIEGNVELRVGDAVVEVAGAGDIFGEMALIESQPRSASAWAKDDSVVVPVDERRFTFMVQETPFFALHVMKVLAHRLRKMDAISKS